MTMPEVNWLSPAHAVSSQTISYRLLDVVVSGTMLLLLSPLLLLVSALIVLESGWPVLFKHQRIGVMGQPFYMYKFRKFHRDCRSNGLQLTLNNDPRLTKVGKFLAESKMDEIPQLWNVLKGDMAIVGPRPESLEFLDCYKAGFEEVLTFKPGLIGPSQVFFRDEAHYYPDGEDPTAFYRKVIFPTKAGLDIAYFRHRTFLSDIEWIFRSALAVIGLG